MKKIAAGAIGMMLVFSQPELASIMPKKIRREAKKPELEMIIKKEEPGTVEAKRFAKMRVWFIDEISKIRKENGISYKPVENNYLDDGAQEYADLLSKVDQNQISHDLGGGLGGRLRKYYAKTGCAIIAECLFAIGIMSPGDFGDMKRLEDIARGAARWLMQSPAHAAIVTSGKKRDYPAGIGISITNGEEGKPERINFVYWSGN